MNPEPLVSFPAGSLPPPAPGALAFLAGLPEALRARVSAVEQDRLANGRDMWSKGLLWIRAGQVPRPPDLVAWPRSEDEVAALVKAARAAQLPVVPFGAGSGVCGGVWATRGGLSLDLKRLEAVGEVDPLERTVQADAGVLGEVLERRLSAQGYTLGHFPSSIYMSTLGGWLAARSAGQLSGKYGKIEDMVASVRAVLGTGEVVDTATGGDAGRRLAALLVGSEGTLCTFTSARLYVHPAPKHRAFRGLRFGSVDAGVEAIRQVFRSGLRPAVVRLYDPFDTAIVGRHRDKRPDTPPSLRSALRKALLPAGLRLLSARGLAHPRLLNKGADVLRHSLLILMFEGEPERASAEEAEARRLCLALGAEDEGEGPGLDWFRHRYSVSYKMSKVLDAGAFADTMEVATTWDKVVTVYRRVRDAVSPLAFCLCHFSHAYLEGCSLYFSFVASDVSEQAQQARYDELWQVALGAALEAGANVSHHHGVGLLKAPQLTQTLGERRRLLVGLRRVLDPDGIMNPGKLGL